MPDTESPYIVTVMDTETYTLQADAEGANVYKPNFIKHVYNPVQMGPEEYLYVHDDIMCGSNCPTKNVDDTLMFRIACELLKRVSKKRRPKFYRR